MYAMYNVNCDFCRSRTQTEVVESSLNTIAIDGSVIQVNFWDWYCHAIPLQ